MLNYTNTLYDNENLSGPDTGAWMTPARRGARAQIPVSIDIASGTATVVIEGTDVLTNDPIALSGNQTTSGHILVDSKVNLRANITAASVGAKVRVTSDQQLLYLS